MSNVAALFNIPTTDTELLAWSSAHATHHRDVIRRIYELTGINLQEYVLDPINPNDTGVWAYQHQLMHQAMDYVLAISGFDLTGVDFKDHDLMEGWIELHGNEHYQAAGTLEIG